MVKLYSVAKPLLICGYHGLTIVTIVMVFGFIFSKTTFNFRKVCVVSALAKPVLKGCEYLSAKFTIVIMSCYC